MGGRDLLEAWAMVTRDDQGAFIVKVQKREDFTNLFIFGTTLPDDRISVRNRVSVSKFTLFPEPEKEEIILVRNLITDDDTIYVLRITWKDGKPFIPIMAKDEGHWWQPTKEKYLQRVNNEIEIIIAGQRFTTDPDGAKNGMCVIDGNILSRYIAGHFTSGDILRYARTREAEDILRNAKKREEEGPEEKMSDTEEKLAKLEDEVKKVKYEIEANLINQYRISNKVLNITKELKGSCFGRNYRIVKHLSEINNIVYMAFNKYNESHEKKLLHSQIFSGI